MSVEISCAFNSSLDSPEHVRIAEQLGYRRAWFYDSPALYADVWVQMCRAAERTERIGLGPGVMVPALRHPMATASAIATLVSIAGESRVAVALSTGFTGRVSMGQPPSRWAFVREYALALRALLRGEKVEWDGGIMQMLHRREFGPQRPIDVPIILGAGGPRGTRIAQEIGDGVFSALQPTPGFDWSIVIVFGTVLDDGEDVDSTRVMDAAGHAASVLLHRAYERGHLDEIPGGHEWARLYDAIPEEERHLAVHEGHLCAVNDHDRQFLTREFMATSGMVLDRSAWRERIAQLESDGATEVVYQPAGPDVPRELEAFAAAVQD